MSAVKAISFDDFLTDVAVQYKDFVLELHDVLIANGYKLKVENKASGPFASYSHPKTKRSILNFFFRKSGFFTRVYADNHDKYADFLNGLTPIMEKEITKSPVCKRLIDPSDCNQKCIMGYDFYIRGTHYQKCRYNCFQFAVNEKSTGTISLFIENEVKGRNE